MAIPPLARGRFLSRLAALALLLAATAVLLAACGFQLRGAAALPFGSLYVQAAPTSQFAVQLKRTVRAGGATRIAERPEEAEVILQILNELQEKQILSLGGTGRVREFELRYRVSFRLTDAKNREHIPATEIVLKRDYSFNDEQALSKESEEALLYRDMRNDAVQQLVRRLQAARLRS
ncbi:MAG TPA: LPS assembly lipoprotein LptE [Burkholderiales bacterium]|nr:LPS assembly lipoprotein LptE [Burkholderiales bacterium]